jgi:hypothetical protein
MSASCSSYQPIYNNTKEKITNFLFHEGVLISLFSARCTVCHSNENTIVFNNGPHDQNNQDFIENRIDQIIESDINNTSKEKVIINNGIEYVTKISLNETTKIIHNKNYHKSSGRDIPQFFILDLTTNKFYPFLPGQEIVDVQMTPDEHTLIAIIAKCNLNDK